MKDIDHDDLMQTLETCGEAMGFALAAALRGGFDFSTNDGINNLSNHLFDLSDSERFSPDVTIAMLGISRGLSAFSRPTPDGEIL